MKITNSVQIAAVLLATLVTLQVKADCDKKADVVFVLDGSSSIYPPDFDKVVAFVKDTVLHFQISPNASRIGLITFSNTVHVKFTQVDFLSKTRLLTEGLTNVQQPYGETRTDLALRQARRLFETYGRQGVSQIAVVITDGASDFPAETARQAGLLHANGVIIFAIGVGEEVVQRELMAIASNGSYAHNVENFDALSSLQSLLANQTCGLTTETTSSTTTTTTTTTTTKAPTTTTPAAQKPSTQKLLPPNDQSAGAYHYIDVVFILPYDLDSMNTAHVLNFIRSIVYYINVHHQGVHIGLLPKVCHYYPGFGLRSGQDLLSLGLLESNMTTSSNTAGLIRRMRESGFRKENGGRSGARRVAVLIVDKSSYDLMESQIEAQRAMDSDIEIFVIAVGNEVSEAETSLLSSNPAIDHVLRVNGYCDLLTISSRLIRGVIPSDKTGSD